MDFLSPGAVEPSQTGLHWEVPWEAGPGALSSKQGPGGLGRTRMTTGTSLGDKVLSTTARPAQTLIPTLPPVAEGFILGQAFNLNIIRETFPPASLEMEPVPSRSSFTGGGI